MKIFLTWLLLAPAFLQAASVVRGPYLQQNAPDSIILRWRTDVSTTTRVLYGPSAGSLTATVDVVGLRTEHEVSVTGLAADTRYYYSVGAVGMELAGNDADHFFSSAPVPGLARPFRAWALGDAGTGDANQAAVRDAYFNLSPAVETDLLLMLGDNAYDIGLDSEYQTAFFDMYASLLRQVPAWSCLGNHDTDSGMPTHPYYDLFSFPQNGEVGGQPSGTEAWFSWDYANVHFVSLDSWEADRSSTGPMLTWLASDLAATSQEWVIVLFHVGPYTKGSHDSDIETPHVEMRTQAVPLMESMGVDLVLSGHSHSYERSWLSAGHTGHSSSWTALHQVLPGKGNATTGDQYLKPAGLSASQGTVYVVAGSSGKKSGGPLNHPVMAVNINELGSVVLDINGPQLDLAFLQDNGSIGDEFRILKVPGYLAPTPTPGRTPGVGAGAHTRLAPVPVPRGESLCVYPARGRELTEMTVYNLLGERVARVSGGQPCWNRTGIASGVYRVKLKSRGYGGDEVEFKKVILD